MTTRVAASTRNTIAILVFEGEPVVPKEILMIPTKSSNEELLELHESNAMKESAGSVSAWDMEFHTDRQLACGIDDGFHDDDDDDDNKQSCLNDEYRKKQEEIQ
jgi:hypothetical protein